MKTIFKITAVFVFFISTSCILNGVRGDRNVVTQQRAISKDFTGIRVSNGIEVHLTMGSDVSLTLEADENLHEIIITEVEDGVLRIYADENIRSAKRRKIYVTASDINELKTTSGAEIISENTIETEDLKVSATSGSDLRLRLDVVNLKCSTTSGADARLNGQADNFIASATSGSDIKASELKTLKCDASVTSGAGISVNASQELDASATSGGSVRYSGNPTKIKKSSTSGGSIKS